MEKDISFNYENIMLRGKINITNENKTNMPIVVMSTGYGGKGSKSKTWTRFTEMFYDRGINTFKFDYSGMGNSDGDIAELTPLNAVKQLEEAINVIKYKPWVNKERIGLIGSSFGGNVALLYTAQYKGISVLGLKSPVSDYCEVRELELGPEGIKLWEKQGYIQRSSGRSNYDFYLDSKSKNVYLLANNIEIPCIIVHGGKDTKVPVEQSRKLANSLAGETKLEIIEGANHKYEGEEYTKIMTNAIVDWICLKI